MHEVATPQLAVGGGVAGQLDDCQSQLGYVQPTKLPVALPLSHVPLYVHHPQPDWPVQVLHDDHELQTSWALAPINRAATRSATTLVKDMG